MSFTRRSHSGICRIGKWNEIHEGSLKEKLPRASSGPRGRGNGSGLCRHAFESSVDGDTALLRRDVITSRARRQGWDKEGRATDSWVPAAATVWFQSPAVCPPPLAPPALRWSRIEKCESYSTEINKSSFKIKGTTRIMKEQRKRAASRWTSLTHRFNWTLANAAMVISSHCADHRDLLRCEVVGHHSKTQNKKKKRKKEVGLTTLSWWLTRQRGIACNTLLLSPGNNTSNTDENRPYQTKNWVNDKKGNNRKNKQTFFLLSDERSSSLPENDQ